jgi:cytoskeletal protein RodZ
MNKGYAAGKVEKTAREILTSMQVVCPDTVWQDLSLELEQTRGISDSGLKNKLSTPQTLILVLLILSGSTFFLWRYMAGKNNVPVTYNAPPPSQIIKSAPKPEPVQSKPILVSVVKDTVAIKPVFVASTQNTPTIASTVPMVQNAYKKQGLNARMSKPNALVKKDSVASSNSVGQNGTVPPHACSSTCNRYENRC